jgi:SAM-dependent methyltransferase
VHTLARAVIAETSDFAARYRRLMADEGFRHPRLAALYDPLDPDRSDLDAYLDLAEDFEAGRVLDIGCGTGVFALLLADRGIKVVGVDPAQASINVALSKPGSDRVQWVCGDAASLLPLQVDLATMTANVVQAIVDPESWQATLHSAYEALRPGGHLVFETRDPAQRAWEGWNREGTHKVMNVPGAGAVESWLDVTEVDGPLVTFRGTYVFATDGQVLTSDSTLRFRDRSEVERDLVAQGYVLEDVREAPDRPGKEFVFLASRPAVAQPPSDTG